MLCFEIYPRSQPRLLVVCQWYHNPIPSVEFKTTSSFHTNMKLLAATLFLLSSTCGISRVLAASAGIRGPGQRNVGTFWQRNLVDIPDVCLVSMVSTRAPLDSFSNSSHRMFRTSVFRRNQTRRASHVDLLNLVSVSSLYARAVNVFLTALSLIKLNASVESAKSVLMALMVLVEATVNMTLRTLRSVPSQLRC